MVKSVQAPRGKVRKSIEPEAPVINLKSHAEVTEAAKAAASGMVTAVVPKRFELTRDHHVPVIYKAGTQKMPRSDAEHWFAKAQGVTIFGED